MTDDELRMDAYYYGFEFTGERCVDRVLSAVACAGKAFHHTESWGDVSCCAYPTFDSTQSPVQWIEGAANEVVAEVRRLRAEVDTRHREYERIVAERDAARQLADGLRAERDEALASEAESLSLYRSNRIRLERERDEALSARTRLEGEVARIHGELSNLYGRLCDTFLGGYSNDRELEIFRHGMATAANCVAAVLRGERNQAPDLSGTPATKPRGVSRAQAIEWAGAIMDDYAALAIEPANACAIRHITAILSACGLSIDDEETGRETKP